MKYWLPIVKKFITYPGRIFFDVMFVGMVTRYATSPETVLTQMVIVTPLTFVPESHERLPVAAFTLDRVEHWKCGLQFDSVFHISS